MFCPKCGTVVLLGKDRCDNCGELVERKTDIIEVMARKKRPEKYSEEIPEAREIIQETCRKCGNKTCYVTRQQLLPADEAETEIYECTKCRHKWRYNDL